MVAATLQRAENCSPFVLGMVLVNALVEGAAVAVRLIDDTNINVFPGLRNPPPHSVGSRGSVPKYCTVIAALSFRTVVANLETCFFNPVHHPGHFCSPCASSGPFFCCSDLHLALCRNRQISKLVSYRVTRTGTRSPRLLSIEAVPC